ncbi:MAG: hypothetical protein ACFFBI_03010, partial [Promethearchaeota archaeon]
MSIWDIFDFGALGAIKYWKEKISTGPLSEKEIRRIKREIVQLMEEGEKLIQEGQYFNGRKLFIGAIQLQKILPSSSSESIDLIKVKIELTE